MVAVRRHLFLPILSLFPLLLSATETDILLDFKDSLLNTKPLDSTWKDRSSPCDSKSGWFGVRCINGSVVVLSLGNLGLSGDLDVVAFQGLRRLRSVDLRNNSFQGPLPQFNLLGSLRSLYLTQNHFSGEIPSDYFSSLRSLRRVWLSGNKLSGKIPESLGKLPNLRELFLENNEFSGPIPTMELPSLIRINMSNNNLEGEIPSGLSKFDGSSFEGNQGLCGKPVGKRCITGGSSMVPKLVPHPEVPKAGGVPETDPGSDDTKPSVTKWVILGVFFALLMLTLVFKAKRREDPFDTVRKENLDEVVHVQIPSTNRRSLNSSGHRTSGGSWRGSSRRGSSHHGGKSVGDLVVVNDEKGTFGLTDLMKAAAEVLGNGGLGSAYKAVMANGVSVVVKRMREMNKMTKETFDTEIRRLARLKHRNILAPLAYHYRKEEKLLVSRYVPRGSLLYILHGDRGISHAELNWPTRLKIIHGIARGMSFLHSEFSSYQLPHGNLKSSNVLLDSNYDPLLTDYALYPLISSTATAQSLFSFKSPESILYQQLSPKSDVFCLGILVLEILTGKFPSQYLSNQKGGTDVVQWARTVVAEGRESEVVDPEIAAVGGDAVGMMEELVRVGAACTESDHDRRIEMGEAIRRIEEVKI